MSKYRLAIRNSLYSSWQVQERRWWGWKTVFSEYDDYDGYNNAKRVLSLLEQELAVGRVPSKQTEAIKNAQSKRVKSHSWIYNQIEEYLDTLEKAILDGAISIVSGGSAKTSRAYGKQAKQEATSQILKLISDEVDKAEHKAYLKGYNSGWVKSNRLKAKPKAIEYFADQLDIASNVLREALEKLKDTEIGE